MRLRACILLEVREAAKWFSLRGHEVNVKVWRTGLGRTSSWISMLHLSPSVVLTFTSKITTILLSPPTGKVSRAAGTFCLSHKDEQSTAALRSHPLQVKITQLAYCLLDITQEIYEVPIRFFRAAIVFCSFNLQSWNEVCNFTFLNWSAETSYLTDGELFNTALLLLW